MADRTGIMAHGDLAEQSRQQQLSSNNVGSVDLNRHSSASNFPMVDLSTQEGFESVKGFTNAQAVVDHLMVLQAPEKWAPSKILSLRNAAAKAIVASAKQIQNSNAWPKGLHKNAGVERVKQELSEKTKVSTADDQVQESKTLLEKEVPANPEIWNVDMNAADLGKAIAGRVQQLMQRIVGCGKDSAELTAHGENSVPKPGASHQPSNLERLAAPQPEPASSVNPSTGAEPATSASTATAPPAAPPAGGSPNPGSLPSNAAGLH